MKKIMVKQKFCDNVIEAFLIEESDRKIIVRLNLKSEVIAHFPKDSYTFKFTEDK